MKITEQLGPAVEVNVKLRLPEAFVEYIETVVKEREYKDFNEFCSYELIQVMIAHLDGENEIDLPKHTIPEAIAYKNNEILEYYIKSDGAKEKG